MTNSMKWLGLGLLTLFMGCNKFDPCSKVDFLMVVDNSGSMQGYQEQMSQQFSTMVAEIDKMDDVDDYRIGIVTTDFNPFNHEGCGNVGDLITASPITPTFDGWIEELKRLKAEDPDVWEQFYKDPSLASAFKAIADSFGADGTTEVAFEWKKLSVDSGEKAPSVITKQCLDDINRPWLEKGDANLEEKFKCLINVGAYRMPIEKPLRAIADSYVSSCNKGFYREDAMFVAMILTDHDDMTESAASIYQDYVNRREGMPNQAVVLPIIPNADGAPNLTRFAENFANHSIGDIGGSYNEVLKKGGKTLQMACDNYGNTCAVGECCMPNDLMKKVVGFGFPPIFGVLAGFLMGRGFGRTAAENKRFTAGPIAKGHFFGGLLSLAAAIGIWEAFCLNCIASNATYYIAGLAATVALLAFSWFSKRSE